MRSGRIDPSVFIAPTATIVGDVTLGAESSVWFGTVLRGDIAPITIGRASNIQDGAILHVGKRFPCVIGDRVTLGHGAIVHGATVENDVLIAMAATVMNGAHIGSQSIVGAGAVVTEGCVIPPRSVVIGVPGRVSKAITAAQIALILQSAENYVAYARAQHSERPCSDEPSGVPDAATTVSLRVGFKTAVQRLRRALRTEGFIPIIEKELVSGRGLNPPFRKAAILAAGLPDGLKKNPGFPVFGHLAVYQTATGPVVVRAALERPITAAVSGTAVPGLEPDVAAALLRVLRRVSAATDK